MMVTNLKDIDLSLAVHLIPQDDAKSDQVLTTGKNPLAHAYLIICFIVTCCLILASCYFILTFIFGYYYIASVFSINDFIKGSDIDKLNTTCSFLQSDGSYKYATPIPNYYTAQSNIFMAKMGYDFLMEVITFCIVIVEISKRDLTIYKKRFRAYLYSLYLIFNTVLLYACRFNDPTYICKPDVSDYYNLLYHKLLTYLRVSSIASPLVLSIIWCPLICYILIIKLRRSYTFL
jgi:hypothetical protein